MCESFACAVEKEKVDEFIAKFEMLAASGNITGINQIFNGSLMDPVVDKLDLYL